MQTEVEPLSYPFGQPVGIDLDPRYGELRRSTPVCRIRLPYGEDGWLVTRHEDVRTVLADPRFSRGAADGRDLPRVEKAHQFGTYGIGLADSRKHALMRKVVAGALTFRRAKLMRPHIEEIASSLVADLRRSGPPADLLGAFAGPLPRTVISELIGVPESDRTEFGGWAMTLNSTSAVSQEEFSDAASKIHDYVTGLIAERRQRPGDDMLSLMAAARDARDELDDEDLHRMTMGVLLAGQVSTMYMIVNSVYALLTHPDQLEILRNDESLIPDAVDELLRFVAGLSHSALQHRIALEDAELSGVRIKAGDAVMVARAAANRDEDVFADPERLDIRRQGNPHLTFGHGTHACPGAHLARVEIQAALRALIHGLPGLALAVPESELRWLTGRPIRGPIEFPVTWSTQPASDRG